jgi:hypothetical protein
MTAALPTTSYQSVDTKLAGWFLLGVFAVVVIGAVIYDLTYGSQVRASLAHQRAAEIEQENSLLCSKLGGVPSTPAFVSCASAIADFRQHVEQRLVNETAAY